MDPPLPGLPNQAVLLGMTQSRTYMNKERMKQNQQVALKQPTAYPADNISG